MTPLQGQTQLPPEPTTTTTPSTPQQTVPVLRRAVYVKVVDLATENNLDIEKIKSETAKRIKQEQAEEEEEEEKRCLKTNDSGTSGSSGNAATTTTTIKSTSTATLQDDTSIQNTNTGSNSPSGSPSGGSSSTRYQKRVVPSTGGFNLCLLVGNIKIVIEKTRVDRSQVRLAECEVGDETGTVSLRARDDQIDLLQQISNDNGAVVLRNCSVELYQGKFIRLAISKWGKISSYPDGVKSTPSPPSSMNNEVNLSIVDLNDVAGDEWFEASSSSIASPNMNMNHQNQHQNRSQRDGTPGSENMYDYSKDTYQQGNQRHMKHHHYNQRGGGSVHGQSHNYQRKGGNMRYGEKRGHGGGGGSRGGQGGYIQHGGGIYAAPNNNAMRIPNINQHYQVAPSMSDYSNLYQQHPSTMPHYGFGQSAGPAHPPHRQHQQHYNPQQQQPQNQQEYLLFQQIQMQLEAMQLYGQRPGLGSSQVGYSQPHAHTHSLPPDGMNPRMETRRGGGGGNWNSNVTNEASTGMPVSSNAGARSQMSPGDYSGIEYITTSQSNDDAWSIRREAQSPMMNPHAATFISNYSVPNLVLPPQQEQYYEQPPAYNPNPGQHSHAPSTSITHHAKENKDESGSVAKQDE